MRKIIGVAGWKAAGKDTIGKYFIDNHGYTKDSFAASLKDLVASVFCWDRELLEGATKESREWRETPDGWWEEHLNWINHPGYKLSERFTPRFALQYIGTQVFRENMDYNIWVSSLKRRLLNNKKVVLTDVRFPNELQMVKDLGGILVWVKRGPLPEWYDCAIKANDFYSEKLFQYPRKSVDHMINKYKVHESEWKWVGWKFDYIIENDGTIEDLYSKLGNLTG